VPRNVVVTSGLSGYVQNISIGPHRIQADELDDSGSHDDGPNPYELLLAALGACSGMTVRMYAERKQWPLQSVQIRLVYSRIHAEDCTQCDTNKGMLDRIEMDISFTGDLSNDQRHRLAEIANYCPVHRTLVSEIQIQTRLTEASAFPSVQQACE
jgi:uncharacterized OsmC-like protein